MEGWQRSVIHKQHDYELCFNQQKHRLVEYGCSGLSMVAVVSFLLRNEWREWSNERKKKKIGEYHFSFICLKVWWERFSAFWVWDMLLIYAREEENETEREGVKRRMREFYEWNIVFQLMWRKQGVHRIVPVNKQGRKNSI